MDFLLLLSPLQGVTIRVLLRSVRRKLSPYERLLA